MPSKKLSLILLLLIVFLSYAAGHAAVKTSDKPLNPKAGRQLILEEVMKIEDTGGDFYFSYISGVKIAPDGSIIVKGWEQLYQFNADGQFLHNYYKKGQGPKECIYLGNFFPRAEELIIHSAKPPKVMFFDLSGRYIKESRSIQHRGILRLIHYYNNRMYFQGSSIPIVKGEPAVVDVPQG